MNKIMKIRQSTSWKTYLNLTTKNITKSFHLIAYLQVSF